MTEFLNVAWMLVVVFKYCGIVLALAGVGIFGFHFIRENGRSARGGGNSIPAAAWRAEGPRFGAWVFASGVLLEMASIIIAVAVPGRT